MKRKISAPIILLSCVLLAATATVCTMHFRAAAKKNVEPEKPSIFSGFYGTWISRGDEYTLELFEDGIVKADSTEFFDLYSMVPTVTFRQVGDTVGVFLVKYPDVTMEFACELDRDVMVITPPVYYHGALILKRLGSDTDLDRYYEEHRSYLER